MYDIITECYALHIPCSGVVVIVEATIIYNTRIILYCGTVDTIYCGTVDTEQRLLQLGWFRLSDTNTTPGFTGPSKGADRHQGVGHGIVAAQPVGPRIGQADDAGGAAATGATPPTPPPPAPSPINSWIEIDLLPRCLDGRVLLIDASGFPSNRPSQQGSGIYSTMVSRRPAVGVAQGSVLGSLAVPGGTSSSS